jgi:ABC-type branched-subunit amino acid transport system ATPase component
MLQLRGIFAGYGGSDVLQGVDLDCAPGTITCIVGPNGAGKSTVLRLTSGLLKPSAGTVALQGQHIGGIDPARILGLGVAQVPQSNALFPHMSIRENVLLGGYILRKNPDLLRERYAEISRIVPLVGERPKDPAGNLSGGQRRMVEVARCLMLDPLLIMLDEPSLGLDPKALASVVSLIKDLNSAGKTILLVEQNVRLGLGIATHGVVMEGGKVRLHGTAEAVLNNPEIAELFLGGTVVVED